MHRFTIDGVSETSKPGRPNSTFVYYDVKLPDRVVDGHAVCNVTDIQNVGGDGWRAHIVNVLNERVADEGEDAAFAELESAEGFRIFPPRPDGVPTFGA